MDAEAVDAEVEGFVVLTEQAADIVRANGAPAAPPIKNGNNGKTTPISVLVLAADRGGEK